MTCYATDLELDMMQACVDVNEPLSVDEARHLIAEVRRLQAREAQGHPTVPLIEWERKINDGTIRVEMCLPEEEMRRWSREELIERLYGMSEQVKYTCLRAWEMQQR